MPGSCCMQGHNGKEIKPVVMLSLAKNMQGHMGCQSHNAIEISWEATRAADITFSGCVRPAAEVGSGPTGSG